VKRLPEGPDWIYELKVDGYRTLIIKDEQQVELRSRKNKALTGIYRGIAAAGLRLKADQAVVDGEIVALDAQGSPAFQALQSLRLWRRARGHVTPLANLREPSPNQRTDARRRVFRCVTLGPVRTRILLTQPGAGLRLRSVLRELELSEAEAARVLRIDERVFADWCAGRGKIPRIVWLSLAAIKIRRAWP
jgi:ATP dependent DNA ligase domain